MRAFVIWGVAVAMGGTCGLAARAQEGGGDARRSAWDRVYTDAQAARGQTLYGRHCEQCHGTGLDGDAVSEIPALAGDTFLQRWSGRNVDDLLTRLVRSMPQAAPGSLTRNEYIDLIAFMLKSNAFPAGFEALGTDSDRLRRVIIERTAR